MNKQLVLLGAGASVEAGVPVTNELTKQLVLKCSESAEYRDSLRAIRFVLGGLMFKAAKDGRDPVRLPFTCPNFVEWCHFFFMQAGCIEGVEPNDGN